MNGMNYNIHGVEIKAVLVQNLPKDKSEVWFPHDIAWADRETLSKHGIGIYYDPTTHFRYMRVDTSLLSGSTTNKVIHDAKSCECGAKAVGASRHSSWCPCNV